VVEHASGIIPSAVGTPAVAAAGGDVARIDQAHAAIGFETRHAMITATQGTECVPLVRIPEIGAAQAKRALDAGRRGSVFR
jgi:4-hydroxy-2-oxoheptanedioate aldolase